jgi:hypothetical protein
VGSNLINQNIVCTVQFQYLQQNDKDGGGNVYKGTAKITLHNFNKTSFSVEGSKKLALMDQISAHCKKLTAGR